MIDVDDILASWEPIKLEYNLEETKQLLKYAREVKNFEMVEFYADIIFKIAIGEIENEEIKKKNSTRSNRTRADIRMGTKERGKMARVDMVT